MMERSWLILSIVLALIGRTGHAQPMTISPTVEFGTPYEIRLLHNGEIIEIIGSFSWSVPQNLSVMLAETPNLKTVRLNSPGGLVIYAMKVGDMIKARGVNTHVDGLCASACTLAFLSGKERTIGTQARLGFHQARAPNIDIKRIDPILRRAYQIWNVPKPFIDHVLATPPESLWVPTPAELMDAGIVTGVVGDSQ